MIEHKLLVEQTLSSDEIFNGELLHVFRDEAQLPDGTSSTREWIKHPGACAVVPIFDNGDLMMLKQFRYPIKQIFWEVPAGKIDPGENQDETAARELQEEAGVAASHLEYVGHFYPGVGYSDELIHIYTAWGLHKVPQQTDKDEFVTRERIPFREAVRMIHSGEINDGKTVICLLRAWAWWHEQGKELADSPAI